MNGGGDLQNLMIPYHSMANYFSHSCYITEQQERESHAEKSGLCGQCLSPLAFV
jgi:hypothetical protein